ncbi:MAG: 2-oxo acid dehydrogenase subunit E2 [Deltaproteobacteria bacterium]
MAKIFPVTVPQLNVNDETVQFLGWLVDHGATVDSEQAICEVETSKSTAELEAGHGGVLFRLAEPGATVGVGGRIALIGPSVAAIETFLAKEEATQAVEKGKTPGGKKPGTLRATPSARALAKKEGVELVAVAAIGVRGSIKESDVRRYLDQRDQTPASPAATGGQASAPTTVTIPKGLLAYLEDDGELSRHERSVAENLRYSTSNLLLTTLEADLDLTRINQAIAKAKQNKVMLSLLHVAMAALVRTLPEYPRLVSFVAGTKVYRYRAIDIAFVARTPDGRLFTPVLRELEQQDLASTAKACLQATLNVNRGILQPEDMEGACFTVSHIALGRARNFVALPNRYQSSILAIAGQRSQVRLIDGGLAEVPVTTLTLSYDHALCDGTYAAEFLDRLAREMELVLT